MHEAHWRYSFLSTQNTYLHFGLCTGVSLLVFHLPLSLFPVSPFPSRLLRSHLLRAPSPRFLLSLSVLFVPLAPLRFRVPSRLALEFQH